MKKLAILIPTLPERISLLCRLETELNRQISESMADSSHRYEVILLINSKDRPVTTGKKRNELIRKAIELNVDSFAFHDDDDLPGPTYIKRGIEFMRSGKDCAELWGQIYWNGKPGMPFHHSIEHKTLWQDNRYYFRPPNHINFIKLGKVKHIMFQEKNFGEDSCWAMDIVNSDLLKTMYPIPEVIYHYYNGHPKHAL